MSRIYKIIAGVLLSLVILLGAGSVFLWRGTHILRERAAHSIADADTVTVTESTASGSVIISEVMDDNRATLRDRDGSFSDWIELKNTTGRTVDLKGWSISHNIQGSAWIFPSVTVGPGEQLVIFASGKSRTGDELHTDFTLDGDVTLYLREPSGRISDISECEHYGSDISSVRGEGGVMQRCVWPTPGQPNTPEGLERFQQNLNSPGPLVIGEVMPFNGGVATQYNSGDCGWIELMNTAAWTVNASDYCLSFDVNDREYWRLPDVSVEPGKCLLIVCDGSGYSGRYGGNVCAPFTLSGENSQLFLFNATGLIDYVGMGGIPNACSYGRINGENGFWFFTQPSPGEPNGYGCRRVSTAPVSLSPDGVFSGEDNPTVALSGSGVIRYTTDGSAPDESSEEYTGPFTVASSCIIRAACFEPDAIQSLTVTLTYIVDEDSRLPVISLVGDDSAAFSRMYSKGRTGEELCGSVSYYSADSCFSLPCGISLSALSSPGSDRRSMVLHFREVYGASALESGLFGASEKLSSLVLRSGGDSDIGYIRNALCHTLASRMGDSMLSCRFSPAVLYLNGSYQGIYFIEEPGDEVQFARSAGADANSVEIYELPIPFADALYQDVLRYAIYNDMSKAENYDAICRRIDMDSFIDMTVLQCSCGNTQFGAGSIRIARAGEDGKWRVILGDMSPTFRSSTGFGTLLSDYAWYNVQISSLLVPLLDNAEFRERLLTRTAQLYSGVLSPESIASAIDEVTDGIASETDRHMSSMGGSADDLERSVNELRGIAADRQWRDKNIDSLCKLLKLSDQEKDRYFGAMG